MCWVFWIIIGIVSVIILVVIVGRIIAAEERAIKERQEEERKHREEHTKVIKGKLISLDQKPSPYSDKVEFTIELEKITLRKLEWYEGTIQPPIGKFVAVTHYRTLLISLEETEEEPM